MSCGACQSQENQSQPRGRCVSDTEESNFGDSAYASDAPSGDECACDKEPSDCCTDKSGCGTGQKGKGQKSDGRRNSQGCGASNGQGGANGGGKRPCPCGPSVGTPSPQIQDRAPKPNSQGNRTAEMGQGCMTNGSTRTGSTNQQYGMGQNSSARRLSQQNGQRSMFGRGYTDTRDASSANGAACNQFNNPPMNQMQQQSHPMQAGGQNSMRASSGRNTMSSEASYGGSPCDTNAAPKQIIAPCCFPNNSLLSLADRNSQPAISRDNSQRVISSQKQSSCGFVPPEVKPSENNAQSFVCPSCAELDNMTAGANGCNTNSENVAEPAPPCQFQPEDPCAPESFPMESEEKPKKKNGGHGFWQQLQFQIYQQQDGEDEDSANGIQQGGNCDPCASESGRNEDFQEVDKPKKSGNKVWQQLTLDIFQSKDDDGSDAENDNSSRQGWQQQLKLQIFQEKYNGDPDEDQGTDVCGAVDEYGEADQCIC